MPRKILLNPYARTIELLFRPEDFDRLQSAADLVWAKNEDAPEDFVESVREDLFGIVTGRWSYGDVNRFPNLKVIAETSGGFPSPAILDYAACFTQGIRVLSCAPAFGPTVAEMGLGLALAVARKIVWYDASLKRGDWRRPDTRATDAAKPHLRAAGLEHSIYGLQAGFIGFGSLASSLKPLLEPFGCPIQVYDPWMTDVYLESHGVTPIDLETLLSTSQLIFVLATPTGSNRDQIGRELLEKIRSDAIFLLLSRSHVVDFDALTDLLLDGRFRAGIDVYPKEPLPLDHPIRNAPNVVFSTHRAGAIQEAFHEIGRIVTNDIVAVVNGLPPREMQVADPAYIDLRGVR